MSSGEKGMATVEAVGNSSWKINHLRLALKEKWDLDKQRRGNPWVLIQGKLQK